MTVKFDAKRLIEIVRDADLEDVRVMKYSGRFMYGRHCVALAVGQFVSEEGVAADLVAAAASRKERTELAQLFKGAKRDSLGLGSVVYFPALEWTDATVEPRDDDDDE